MFQELHAYGEFFKDKHAFHMMSPRTPHSHSSCPQIQPTSLRQVCFVPSLSIFIFLFTLWWHMRLWHAPDVIPCLDWQIATCSGTKLVFYHFNFLPYFSGLLSSSMSLILSLILLFVHLGGLTPAQAPIQNSETFWWLLSPAGLVMSLCSIFNLWMT